MFRTAFRAAVIVFYKLVIALLLLLCSCDSRGIRLVLFVPSENQNRVENIFRAQITATSSGGSSRIVETSRLSELSLPDLEEDLWNFRIDAFDSSGTCLLQGQTIPIRVFDGMDEDISMILSPPEAIVPIEEEVDGQEIAARCHLSATTFTRSDDRSSVLVAGGSGRDGLPTREAWVYIPERLEFVPVGSMSCPRSGHSAVAVRGSVLIAGGGTERCDGMDSNAANTVEIFDVETLEFSRFEFSGGDVSGSGYSEIVRYSEDQALLVSENQVFLLDVPDRSASVLIDDLQINNRTVPIATANSQNDPVVVVVGEDSEQRTVSIYNESGICSSMAVLGELPTDSQMFIEPFEGGVLISRGQRWWALATSSDGCSVLQTFTGSLSAARNGNTATLLHDGRVLIVGGLDPSRRDTSVFLPLSQSNGGVPFLYSGPPSEHNGSGHAVASLPDNTALIVGCDRSAEVFNADRDQNIMASSFELAPKPESYEHRIIFIVDGSEEASWLRGAVASRIQNVIPRGFGTDISPSVGVLSGQGLGPFERIDGCGRQEPQWVSCPDGNVVTGQQPQQHEVDPLLGCRLEWAGYSQEENNQGRCPTSAPLAVVDYLIDFLERQWEPDEDIGQMAPASGVYLLVILASKDDCSFIEMQDSFEFTPPDNCDERHQRFLRDPAGIAERVKSHVAEGVRLEIAIISDFEDLESGASRLATFSSELEDHGTTYVVHNDQSLNAALNSLAQRARELSIRTACIDSSFVDSHLSCTVYTEHELEGTTWIEPLPRSFWTFGAFGSVCSEESGEMGLPIRIVSRYPGPEVGRLSDYHALCR